jgi:hypothetical protein
MLSMAGLVSTDGMIFPDTVDTAVEGSDAMYARVGVRGVIGGWIVCAVVFALIARLGLPEADWRWWLGVSLGAALWCGPFFGLVVSNAAFQLRLEQVAHERRAERSRTAAEEMADQGGGGEVELAA